ncbi:MAG: YetF domain-containing protein [Holdemania massiliensis]
MSAQRRLFNLEEVNYAVLEPTGNLSVLPHDAARPLSLPI